MPVLQGALPKESFPPAVATTRTEDYTHLPFTLPLTAWTDEHDASVSNDFHRKQLLTHKNRLWLTSCLYSPLDAGVSNAFHRKQLLTYKEQLMADMSRKSRMPDKGASESDSDEEEGVLLRTYSASELRNAITTAQTTASESAPPREPPIVRRQASDCGKGKSQVKAVNAQVIKTRFSNAPEASGKPAASGSGKGIFEKVTGDQIVEQGKSQVKAVNAQVIKTSFSNAPETFCKPAASGSGKGIFEKVTGDKIVEQAKSDRCIVGDAVAKIKKKVHKHAIIAEKQGLGQAAVAAAKEIASLAAKALPWPGDVAAAMLSQLLDMSEVAIINSRNWKLLNHRTADLLQLIMGNTVLQSDTPAYRSIVNRLINTLTAIKEYYRDYTNRNWLIRIVSSGGDNDMFHEFWRDLQGLAQDTTLCLGIEANAKLIAMADRLTNVPPPPYTDDAGKILKEIDNLGGLEVVLKDGTKLQKVAEHLETGSQLSLLKMQEATALLEVMRDEGVHSLILHLDLRIFWRKCFTNQDDVLWDLWWDVFPEELKRVPLEKDIIGGIKARLADPRRRKLFQERLHLYNPDRISVGELRRAFTPADADLSQLVFKLTSSPALDGDQHNNSSKVGLPFLGCMLPRVDARFMEEQDDAARLEEQLSAGYQRDSRGLTRCTAVCVVADPGLGKSSIAIAAAWNLWESKRLPGGAYTVDLNGVSSLPEVLNRFLTMMGQPTVDDMPVPAPIVASVLTLLKRMATRGCMLLLIDNVDTIACENQEDAFYVMQDLHALIGQILDVLPACKLLVTAHEPLFLSSAAADLMRYFHMGALKQREAVKLVQGMVKGMSPDEAKLLVEACKANPLILRMAAQALSAGNMNMQESVTYCQSSFYNMKSVPPSKANSRVPSANSRRPMGSRTVSSKGPSKRPSLNGEHMGLALVSSGAATPHDNLRSPGAHNRGKRAFFDLPVVRETQTLPPPSANTPSPSSGLPPVGRGNFSKQSSHNSSVPTELGSSAYNSLGVPSQGTFSERPSKNSSAGRDILSERTSKGSSAGQGSLTPSMAAAAAAQALNSRMNSLSRSGGYLNASSMASSMTATQLEAFQAGLVSILSARSMASSMTATQLEAFQAGLVSILCGLSEPVRLAVAQLSLFPYTFDAESASAVLGVKTYAMRSMLDTLQGYSLLVKHSPRSLYSLQATGHSLMVKHSQRRLYSLQATGYSLLVKHSQRSLYSLQATVHEAGAVALLAQSEVGRCALYCRFVTHILSELRKADKLYTTAVQASMQLATELRSDLRTMLQMTAVLGMDGLFLMARTPLFSALFLDHSREYLCFWRFMSGSAAAGLAVEAGQGLSSPCAASHLRSSLEMQKEEDAGTQSLALRCLAIGLLKSANYMEAEECFVLAVELSEAVFGEKSLEVAASLSGMGHTLVTIGRYPEAEVAFRRAYNIRKGRLGGRCLEAAASSADLGRALLYQGKVKEADPMLRYQPGTSRVIQKNYTEGESLQRIALDMRVKIYGDDHPDIAESSYLVGAALLNLGKTDEAEAKIREALLFTERAFGPSHPSTCSCLIYMGQVLEKEGKSGDAESLYLRAQALAEPSLGPTHPMVCACIANLMIIARKLKKDKEVDRLSSLFKERFGIAISLPLGDELLDKHLAAIFL
eukprot:gene23915-9486_t